MNVSAGNVRRAMMRAAVAAIVLTTMVLAPGVASAATVARTAVVASVAQISSGTETGPVAIADTVHATANDKDSDDDTIPDIVEREVCGTATCALGTEDRDDDGIPDVTEVLSCDTSTCASPTKDADADGIPDFAERLVCDVDTCSNSLEDADGDRIGDWVEFVICGTRTCADGSEDYDGNGVSDAAELAACVVRIDDLAITGGTLALWILILALVLIGGGLGLRLWQRRRASRRMPEEERDRTAGPDGDLGYEDDTDAATSEPVPDEDEGSEDAGAALSVLDEGAIDPASPAIDPASPAIDTVGEDPTDERDR